MRNLKAKVDWKKFCILQGSGVLSVLVTVTAWAFHPTFIIEADRVDETYELGEMATFSMSILTDFEGEDGPQEILIRAKVDNVPVGVVQIDEDHFESTRGPFTAVELGDHVFEATLFIRSQAQADDLRAAIESANVRRDEFIVLRDNASDPQWRDFYQMKIDEETRAINEFFAQLEALLTEVETRTEVFHVVGSGQPGNSPPVAEDDTADTTAGVAVTFDVLDNDSDPDGDPVSVVSHTIPGNGLLQNNGDGTFTFGPDPGFMGQVSFDYIITDGKGALAQGTVVIDVGSGIPADWFDADFKNRIKITFDNSAQSQDLTEFPVRVRLDGTRIDFSKTEDTGADLRFVDADGVTLLAHEIEEWDESGTSDVWVNIPQVDGSSNTDFFWLYYDNPTATTVENPNGTWNSGYKGVWHLNQDPSPVADQVNDSTQNGNQGDTLGTMDLMDLVTGLIAGAFDFDGVDDAVSFGNVNTDTDDAITLEAVVNWRTVSDERIFCKSTGTPTADHAFCMGLVDTGAPNKTLRIRVGTDGSGGSNATNMDVTDIVSGGEFVYLAFSWDRDYGLVKSYVNGVKVGEFPKGGETLKDSTAPLVLGNVNEVDDRYFDGIIDEPRLSNVLRMGDWIAAQHLSHTDGFLTYSPVESIE